MPFLVYNTTMMNIMQLFQKLSPIPSTPRPPKTIEEAYWEHPAVNDTPENAHGSVPHPHKLTVWHHDEKTGKSNYGTVRTLWPFTNYMWILNYARDTRGQQLDDNQVALYKKMQQWCLENCQGRWIWSLNEGKFFIERGSPRTVGWHQDRTFYLSIEFAEDAAHFRLVFDWPCNCLNLQTKQQIIEEINQKNKEVGWKKYSIK